MAFLNSAGVTKLTSYLRTKFAALSNGVVAVSQGGTGAATHTANAVLTGNGTSAVNDVATADGALYATTANGVPQFGTLPVAQGGTGGTTAALARTNLSVPSTTDLGNIEASIADVESTTATASHAKGDYFMLGNVLMKATVAIATGEQITTSNATPATVQSQIDALRDSLSDNSPTYITITSTKFTAISGDAYRSYYITRGGLTYVSLNVICVTPTTSSEAVCTLPRSIFTTDNLPNARDYYHPEKQVPVLLQNGTLYLRGGEANVNYSVAFCYPSLATTQ